MTTEIDGEPVATDDFASQIAAEVEAEAAKADAPKTRKPRGPNKPKGEKPTPAFVYSPNEGDIQIGATVFGVIWGIVAPFAKVADVDENQKRQAGEALAPLIQKYMPILGNWQYEVAALIAITAIAIECKRNYVEPVPEADVVETAVRRDSFGRPVA